jgi:elongation factor P
MIQATQIRAGMILAIDGNLYRVLSTNHVTPGKGNALMATELRDLKSGIKIDRRFRSSETVEKAIITTREMEYLYADGEQYTFMDTENYEQCHMSQALLGDGVYYLQANMKFSVSLYDGSPIGVEFPTAVELEITDTDPPMRGATASSSNKPAKLSNGVTTKVPPYLKVGDKVRVNPNTGEFVERV